MEYTITFRDNNTKMNDILKIKASRPTPNLTNLPVKVLGQWGAGCLLQNSIDLEVNDTEYLIQSKGYNHFDITFVGAEYVDKGINQLMNTRKAVLSYTDNDFSGNTFDVSKNIMIENITKSEPISGLAFIQYVITYKEIDSFYRNTLFDYDEFSEITNTIELNFGTDEVQSLAYFKTHLKMMPTIENINGDSTDNLTIKYSSFKQKSGYKLRFYLNDTDRYTLKGFASQVGSNTGVIGQITENFQNVKTIVEQITVEEQYITEANLWQMDCSCITNTSITPLY